MFYLVILHVQLTNRGNCEQVNFTFTNGSCAPDTNPCSRTWRTYLNVVQLNRKVVVPVYTKDRKYESEAISIWESTGYEVVPVVSDEVIKGAGSVHCLTKTIPKGVTAYLTESSAAILTFTPLLYALLYLL